MGELNNFHINDDGSVTVEQQLSEQERNILDIFKIEKSKGGIFASRRMKKRALKYAKSVNYPEFKVDKMMLDSYPDDFANYHKTTKLIVTICLAAIFFLGAVCLAFPAYFDYESSRVHAYYIHELEEDIQLGNTSKYNNSYCLNVGLSEEASREAILQCMKDDLRDLISHRDNDLEVWSYCLRLIQSCLAVCIILIIICVRISSSLTSDKNKELAKL